MGADGVIDEYLITRRSLLQAAGWGTLAGFVWPLAHADEAAAGEAGLVAAYVRVEPSGRVVITTPAAEMGQGIYTALPAILADEMGADFERVAVELAPAGEAYINPMKNLQATGRSMSVRGYYPLLRRVGAMARDRLRAEAAARWNVALEDTVAAGGRIRHVPSGQSLGFGDLADGASRRPLPAEPELKQDKDFTLIGHDVPRKDVPAKVDGSAIFGTDVALPNVLSASVRTCPVFGGRVARYDAAAARAMPGVHAIVEIENGIAAVADSWWEANRAVQAVEVEWDAPDHAFDSEAYIASLREAALEGEGRLARDDGDAEGLIAADPKALGGVYDVPYLAHATMEPLSCTARVSETGCELWATTQGPIRVRDLVAAKLDLPADRVKVNRTFMGGGFGRRWQPDFCWQAVQIARQLPGRAVKLVWSREEDIQHGYYRPAHAFAWRASLTGEGELAALTLRSTGQSLIEFSRPGALGDRADPMALGGLADLPYAVPNLRIDWVPATTPVPVGVWRAVAHSQNGFFLESAIDEIAVAAGQDPYRFRRRLLGDRPRFLAVLDRAAAVAGWDRPLAPGRGRGIAIMEGWGSVVAEVAEVTLGEGTVSVDRIVSAIDCGTAVQPDNVRAQMEGGILFGLSAFAHGRVDVRDGRVAQSNFGDYRILSLADAPAIEVEIVASGEPLGGVGEPPLPPVAPAVANAIAAAGGPRLTSLPLARHGLRLGRV